MATKMSYPKVSNMVKSEFYSAALREADAAEPNNELVMDCLLKAKEEGDPRATYALAQCYRYGSFGTDFDLEKAHKLTKQLENSNIAEAVFNLALDYDKGNFVRTNLKKAFSLYVVAGLLGDKESCEQVACFYRAGEVVPRNKALEKAWRARARCDETLISPPYRCWLR